MWGLRRRRGWWCHCDRWRSQLSAQWVGNDLQSHTMSGALHCIIWEEFSRSSVLIKRTEDTEAEVPWVWRSVRTEIVRHILPRHSLPPLKEQTALSYHSKCKLCSVVYTPQLSCCTQNRKASYRFSKVFNCLIMIPLWKLSGWWNHRSHIHRLEIERREETRKM